MTPKEKAEELYKKYEFVYIQNYTSKFDIKECAKIAVDEVINAYYAAEYLETKGYWYEVKEEIEKI